MQLISINVYNYVIMNILVCRDEVDSVEDLSIDQLIRCIDRQSSRRHSTIIRVIVRRSLSDRTTTRPPPKLAIVSL